MHTVLYRIISVVKGRKLLYIHIVVTIRCYNYEYSIESHYATLY